MELILVRTALAPCLVLLVSVASRCLGSRLAGRLLGAPTTTGPFLVVVCLSSGAAAASGAAVGSVAGQLAVACFCLAYGRIAATFSPAATLVFALACAGAGGTAGTLTGNEWLTAGLAAAVIAAGLLTWPASAHVSRHPAARARAWEIPARMALSGVTVLAAILVADAAGSFAGGMLSSLPVLLGIVTPSVHRGSGAQAASDMMHGALVSAAGTIGFLLVLSCELLPLGPWPAFVLAIIAMAVTDCLVRWLAGQAAGRMVFPIAGHRRGRRRAASGSTGPNGLPGSAEAARCHAGSSGGGPPRRVTGR